MAPSPHIALEGFLLLEEALQETTRYIPYCPEHLEVWSPRFATIILEAASQFNSLLRAASVWHGCCTPAKGRGLNIGHYLEYFGRALAPQWAVFFGGESRPIVRPFAAWRGSGFTTSDYPNHPLTWWGAYNQLKHDRLSNLNLATQAAATEAVVALLLALLYSGTCDAALIQGLRIKILS